MCEEECRKRYHFTSMRKGNILRARKYLNDVLLDQLPVLAGVQRWVKKKRDLVSIAMLLRILFFCFCVFLFFAFVFFCVFWRVVLLERASHLRETDDRSPRHDLHLLGQIYPFIRTGMVYCFVAHVAGREPCHLHDLQYGTAVPWDRYVLIVNRPFIYSTS